MAGRQGRRIDPEQLRQIRVEARAQRAVGCWWNAQRFNPDAAERVRVDLPDLVEALEELGELVMPKSVTGGPFKSG